jgi:hypothetical protein
LEKLCQALIGNKPGDLPGIGGLRYQLFYGIAAALAYAGQVDASHALFVVHEFVTPKTKTRQIDANERDLQNFLSLLAPLTAPFGQRLHGPVRVPGNDYIPGDIPLYIGKVRTVTGAKAA